ncbi:MAG: hypothetical protein PHS66_07950 [Candidatus Omnitrophica bacterium]|nr:hypothetical protein [Candidatus Omnitrophota bacterium]
MNIFVGNLSFEAKEVDVERAFAAFGVVTSVAIVMEKKGKKSRGFGFVEMPDEQEALAAIAQLDGKEILGRPINAMAALSKEPKTPAISKKNKYLPEVMNNDRGGFRPKSRENFSGQDFPLKRTGKYKEGRRTISFMKQRMAAGITEAVPERRYKPNPMRWRKKPRWEKPFAKPEGEFKPWQRPQTESKPWKRSGAKPGLAGKAGGGPRPWESSRGESRPWKKTDGEPNKFWDKKPQRPGSWKKTESASKPWKKPAGETKPWQAAGKPKPWRKSSADRAQSGFKKPRRFSR